MRRLRDSGTGYKYSDLHSYLLITSAVSDHDLSNRQMVEGMCFKLPAANKI